MALSLIAKRFSQFPIGTHVELTYGDTVAQQAQFSGVITDSDFMGSVEVTDASGKAILLDAGIIRMAQPTKTLEDVLKKLSPGTQIRFSYGAADQREPAFTGTVADNDGETSLEIRPANGKSLMLEYSMIRSCLPAKNGLKTPEPPKKKTISLCDKVPEDILNRNDGELKTAFEEIPRADRLKLSSAFDSFKYGIRINDRDKMATAAKQAQQIIFREEDDNDYYWSAEAARFCAYLLRRVNIYDADVLLAGECFREAAYAAWRNNDYDQAAAYAIVSLTEENPATVEDLLTLVAWGVDKTQDASALSLLARGLGNRAESTMNTLLSDLFCRKNRILPEMFSDALQEAEQLYPKTGMAKLVRDWMKEVPPVTDKPGVTPAVVEKETVMSISGVISRLNWMNQTGTITGDDGKTYTFRYADLEDAKLKKAIEDCMRADLDGKTYSVCFRASGSAAGKILPHNAPVDRARAIAADASREDRFQVAFALCKTAVGTPDTRRALTDLVKYTMTLYGSTQDTTYPKQMLELYEQHSHLYPNSAFALLDVAQCYSYLGKHTQMMLHAEKAAAITGLSAKQHLAVLTLYLKLAKSYYDISGDKKLLENMVKKIDGMELVYSRDLACDAHVKKTFASTVLPYRIMACCGLDLLKKAESDLSCIPAGHSNKQELVDLVERTHTRLMPAEETLPVREEHPVAELQAEEVFDDSADDEDEEADILPYTDHDGWDALKTTEKEVVSYALGITGPQRTGAMLAYLRAGAMLNPKLAPVYRTLALAANDPMEAPDYSVTSLVNALAENDSDYPELNDCCMGAAYLRASFLSGMGYDYSAQALRDSISIQHRIPALREAYDALEAFRKETGRSVDIYADYRNQGVKKLQEELDATIRHAQELYTKFVLTPAREGVKFARLLETKKILFDRDGDLATMLRHIIEGNQDALTEKQQHFASTYLSGTAQFSPNHISSAAIDSLIAVGWEEAGKNMRLKKPNATLQGDRRNNLRSNISDILSTICQWYALSQQSAGLTWRTAQGEQSYQNIRPRLLAMLEELEQYCRTEEGICTEPQTRTGLFLLGETAHELHARLDGSWKFEQEKFLYIDFLRSNHVMLDENFMPELESTFCALPAFNIFQRIRRHVEEPRVSWQEQIDRIYGMDKRDNNYGTAERIVEYLNAMGDTESVTLPENPQRFVTHSQMQIDMRCRSFRETYALALNYGQIIKSDAFCYTLEDTVRYWFSVCKASGNCGFFSRILQEAENQIHTSAQQYESQLDEQLDALIAGNRQYFDQHPDYAEAIRAQISGQNFTVAEDWMARIRIGDFSLDVQQPEALDYLEHFWNSYVVTYNRVADASRTLSSLLGRREVRNKDAKRAQQLIDNWLSNGNPSNCDRIGQLLNLLGWQNIRVTQYQLPGDPRAEIYQVRKEADTSCLTTPQHPIAAYGSALEKKPMYIACLYGIYDCDRLYEKMRALDAIDGSKIILLDYALGQADRRALARKLKKRESALRNVNMVIDRVLITHLANNYNENLINRILMALAMPFSYCQPYVVESVHTMPPEIFIGRKDELLKIEQPDGVNLIFGGRQLGKSALFKKALADIDGHQNQRAVLIDIKELNCAAAARKLSTKLIDLNITPDGEITEDWDVLCRNIERRLRNSADPIPYFLLMLDEADAFINDCASCGYRPLVALKDVQQSLPGQFKYVLAGLHNIVRFNRQVALGNNSVITHMPSLKITPFHTPEAQELLTGPLSYLGFSLPSRVTVSQILATCNYFPGLIQLYAKKLIESMRTPDYAGYDIKKTPPYVISDEHLRRVMSDKEFVEQIHEKFEITLTLDQDQGSCYYPLTLLIGWMYNVAPSKNGYTAKDVLHHARDLCVYPLANLDEEKINALLLELQDLNILRSVSNNSYLLASKNFRDLLGSDEEIFEKLMKVGGFTQ